MLKVGEFIMQFKRVYCFTWWYSLFYFLICLLRCVDIHRTLQCFLAVLFGMCLEIEFCIVLQNLFHIWLLVLEVVIRSEISCSKCCVSTLMAYQLALLYNGTFLDDCLCRGGLIITDLWSLRPGMIVTSCKRVGNC